MSGMTLFVTIMMFGWIPILLVLFSVQPPRRAVLYGFLFAWLFLPMAEFKIPGLPGYNKMSATCVGVLLAVCLFDARRLSAFRWRWVDVPMIVWCLAPMASSLSNGLGAYDGFSAAFRQTVAWGLPYFIGRLYFTDLPALRELAIGIFLGGLIYVPLCLFEIRMSPQLHYTLYGFHQHAWEQTFRFGGWRPMVFMQHGLMVGMWMVTACLTGFWLWYTGALTRWRGWSMGSLLVAIFGTTVLCKSFGALLLLALGVGALVSTRLLKSRVVLVLMLLMPVVYIGARTTRDWSGQELVSLAMTLNEARAESLQIRLNNETLLARKALQQPMFGWGGWGRNRVYNAAGEDISITDSFWIIAFGTYGLVGLGALMVAQLLPVVLFMRRVPARFWSHPALAAPAALSILLLLYAFDNLMNAMINPIFMLGAGGLGSLVSGWAVPATPARMPDPHRTFAYRGYTS